MCDPLTMLLGVAGAAGSLLMQPDIPDPPPLPAPAAPPPSPEDATVKIGNTDRADETVNEQFRQDTPRRQSANALGNLGRSGLTI